MHVEHLGESDEARWTAYVEPRASTVTDLFAWRRVVGDAYGIASHFLLATEGGRPMGALALYEIRHPVFGHYLATALFGTDGGLFFESASARDALLAEATALRDQLRAGYVVIRQREVALAGFEHETDLRTAVVSLDGDPDAIFARLPGKTRNQVRRGQKEGFDIAAGAAEIGAFHAVFHRHMRRLGSPAHSRAYYEAVARHLGERALFLVVRDGRTVVAGALLCVVNATAANLHTVALAEYNPRCPNYLLYWRMIEEARARGCRALDMGRSALGSTQLAFKENWGPAVIPLVYNYGVAGGAAAPKLDPRNPKYAIAVAAWRRLPLFVTKALGPRLISGIA